MTLTEMAPIFARITDGGVSQTDTRILDYVNEAHMRLMPKGDYVNTLVNVTGSVINQYITLPSQLHSLRSLTLASQQTAVNGFMGSTGTTTDNQYNITPLVSGFVLSNLKFDKTLIDKGDIYDGGGALIGRSYYVPGAPVTGTVPFQAVAKLRYQALTLFTQTPIIQNVTGLKKIIHSIFLEEKNQVSDAMALETSAIQYMEEEAKNFWGDSTLQNVNDAVPSFDNTLRSARKIVSPLLNMSKDDLRVDHYINVGMERLILKGLWKTQFQKLTFCTLRNYITMPYDVESAYMVSADRIPGRIFGQWYEFQESGPGEIDRYRTSTPDIIDMGFGFQTIYDPFPGFYIAITSTAIEDPNSFFTVTGTDQNNNPVTKNYSYSTGNPVYDTTQQWNTISIKKGITNGIINLYFQNIIQPLDFDLIGIYQKFDTLPSYRRYRVGRIFPMQNSDAYALDQQPSVLTGTTRPVRVTILAKKKFVPTLDPDQDLFIPYAQAVKHACIAVHMEEKGPDPDVQSAAAYHFDKAQELLEDQISSTATETGKINMNVSTGTIFGGYHNML